jgi:hypothetical protein
MWLQTQDGVRLTHEAFYYIPLGRYQALKHVGMWKMKFFKKLKTFENGKNNFFVSFPNRIHIGASNRAHRDTSIALKCTNQPTCIRLGPKLTIILGGSQNGPFQNRVRSGIRLKCVPPGVDPRGGAVDVDGVDYCSTMGASR